MVVSQTSLVFDALYNFCILAVLGLHCGLSCPVAYGILVPWPGIEPMSPPLQGGFFTTGPPGKSCPLQFWGVWVGHPVGAPLWKFVWSFFMIRWEWSWEEDRRGQVPRSSHHVKSTSSCGFWSRMLLLTMWLRQCLGGVSTWSYSSLPLFHFGRKTVKE